MGRYNIAVIGNRKNIIDRMCALIPDYIDYFEEETCRVIRVVGRHTIISSGFTVKQSARISRMITQM